MTPTNEEKAAQAVKAIRAFHARGKALRGGKNAKTSWGMSAEKQRLARQFADPEAGYTDAEVDDLCTEIETVQGTPEHTEAVCGITHLYRLITVPREKGRRKIQTKAIVQGWSTRRLEDEIRTGYGSRRDGGRKPRMPKDKAGLLSQIETTCESWRRWQKEVEPAEPAEPGEEKGPKKKKHAVLADLPAAVVELVRAVGTAVNALHERVAAELAARKKNRTERHRIRKLQKEEDGAGATT